MKRYNRILASILGKLFDGKDWHKSLGEIEFEINNTVNRATGEIPSKLLYGVRQRGKVVDVLKQFLEDQAEFSDRNLEQTRSVAAEKI